MFIDNTTYVLKFSEQVWCASCFHDLLPEVRKSWIKRKGLTNVGPMRCENYGLEADDRLGKAALDRFLGGKIMRSSPKLLCLPVRKPQFPAQVPNPLLFPLLCELEVK